MDRRNQKPVEVNQVASYLFCPRRLALSVTQRGQEAWVSVRGRIEHELQRQLVGDMRRAFLTFRVTGEVRTFKDEQLIDVLDGLEKRVNQFAQSWLPLHSLEVATYLKNRVGHLLEEWSTKCDKASTLIESGIAGQDLCAEILPTEVEKGIFSEALGVVGRLDQLWDQKEGSTVVDLKTTPPEMRPLTKDYDENQVALYAMMITEKSHKETGSTIHYLPDGEQVQVEVNETRKKSIRSAIGQVPSVVGRAQLGFLPPKLEMRTKCSACPYTEKCFALGDRFAIDTADQSNSSIQDVLESATKSAVAQAIRDQVASVVRAVARKTSMDSKDALEILKDLRARLVQEFGHSPEDKARVRKAVRAIEHRMAGTIKHVNGTGSFKTADFIRHMFEGAEFVEPMSFDYPGLILLAWKGPKDFEAWFSFDVAAQSLDVKQVAFRIAVLLERQLSSSTCRAVVVVDGHGEIRRFPTEFENRLSAFAKASSSPARLDTEATQRSGAPAAIPTAKAAPETPPGPQRNDPAACPDVDPAKSEIESIGSIEESRTAPLHLSESKRCLWAFVKPEYMDAIRPGDYLLAYDPTLANRKVFCRYAASDTYPISASVPFASVKSCANRVRLEPICESIDGSEPTRMSPGDFSAFKLFLPTPHDLQLFMNLPSVGLPIGTAVAGAVDVPLYFPLVPQDALYRSTFFTGVKGKGKTTAVRNLVVIATSYTAVPIDQRPCIVVIDGEKEFTSFNLTRASDLLRKHYGIHEAVGSPLVETVRVAPGSSDLKILATDVELASVPLLLPSLPEKTAGQMGVLLDQFRGVEDFGWLDFTNRMVDEVRGSNLIHSTIKAAMCRALFGCPLRTVLEPSAAARRVVDFLAPGKVVVFDVADLSTEEKRVVSMYILLALEKVSQSERRHPGLLVVMDEAERLFPRKKTGALSATYIDRVTSEISDKVHRGRRKHFGMILCTQYPSDVDARIVDNCDFKVTFSLAAQDSWVRSNLGKHFVEGVKELNTGECFMDFRKILAAIPVLRVRLPRSD